MKKKFRKFGLFVFCFALPTSWGEDLNFSRSVYVGADDTIRIFEIEPSAGIGRRVAVSVLSSDGKVRIYELKTLSIGNDPYGAVPEWAKQFQTLGGFEIRIPLGSQ